MTREEIAGCLEAACKLCDAAYDAWKADQRSERFWADYTSAQRTASDVLRAYQNAIFAALRADSPEAVERAAKTLSFRDVGPDETADEWWDGCEEDYRRIYRDDARAALRAALEPQP
jgi:hypothetical protein